MEQVIESEPAVPVVLHVSPGPHVHSRSLSTRRMMLDVLIALTPVMVAAVAVFRLHALMQVGICVASCLIFEWLFAAMRSRRASLGDGSAAVTGVILGLSLPWSAPWYVAVIAGMTAVGLGKAVFGGLGQNIFNPAMVGRAFVMMSFPAMGAKAYIGSAFDVVSQATPLSAAKTNTAFADLWVLFVGNHNGSLGEVSAVACLLGGIYLCVRRTASWEIPVSAILSVALFAGIGNLMYPSSPWTVAHHLLSGALLFGAFYIATDPVSSPLTPVGKWIFGAGLGGLVVLIRVFTNYPEGVMFAVLIMNSVVPLINRWTIPTPVGGPWKPVKK